MESNYGSLCFSLNFSFQNFTESRARKTLFKLIPSKTSCVVWVLRVDLFIYLFIYLSEWKALLEENIVAKGYAQQISVCNSEHAAETLRDYQPGVALVRKYYRNHGQDRPQKTREYGNWNRDKANVSFVWNDTASNFVVVCKISNFNPMKIFPLRLSRRKSLQPTVVLSSTTLTQEIRLQVQMTIVGIKCKWRQNGSNKWNMKLKR